MAAVRAGDHRGAGGPHQLAFSHGRHLVLLGVLYLALIFVALYFGRSWSIGLSVIGPIAVLVVAVVLDAIVLGVASRRLLAKVGADPASRFAKSRRV